MKVDYEELLGYYKAVRYGRLGDGEYEDAIASIIDAVQDIVKERKAIEAENARLKKQCEHLACDVVSALQDYGAPMSDCRSCDYDRFCKRKPGQIEPNWDMCEAAVLKACEPEEAGE